MSKLTDELIDNLYINGTKHWIGKREIARAVEVAVTEPLLQRIAELESENEVLNRLMRSGEQRGVAKGLEESKAQITELERQLEEARNQVLEEAAMCCDAEEKRAQHNMTCDIPKNYEFWNGGAMFAGQLAEEIRALKGAKE